MAEAYDKGQLGQVQPQNQDLDTIWLQAGCWVVSYVSALQRTRGHCGIGLFNMLNLWRWQWVKEGAMRLTMNTAGFSCWTKRRRAEILTRAGARFKWARARADDAAYVRYNLMGRADWSSDMGHRTNGRIRGIDRQDKEGGSVVA